MRRSSRRKELESRPVDAGRLLWSSFLLVQPCLTAGIPKRQDSALSGPNQFGACEDPCQVRAGPFTPCFIKEMNTCPARRAAPRRLGPVGSSPSRVDSSAATAVGLC